MGEVRGKRPGLGTRLSEMITLAQFNVPNAFALLTGLSRSQLLGDHAPLKFPHLKKRPVCWGGRDSPLHHPHGTRPPSPGLSLTTRQT